MRQCSICGKGSVVRISREKLRGKYNPTKMERKYPNLQYTRLRQDFGGQARGKRVLACTKCIKRSAKVTARE